MPEGERRRPRDPRDAVRVGVPLTPLSDLYYRLMEGSWAVLVGGLIVSYMLANVGFAGLYMLDESGIATAENGSFSDAFFFSVQTISTIGYGAMAPKTPYVHMLVTAEAMIGLLGFAIATGLMFAKFSRPSARVLFSNCLVVTQRHGKPALMLRAANARGNDVVEASMHITMLATEHSPEGHQMRRLYDLDLIRTKTPVFVLSWLLIHEIDENSPLYGYTEESLLEEDAIFIIAMTGLDATLSDTVYARHMYAAQDVKWGHRFIDVIDRLDDGRVRIDYTKFHDTIADADRA